MNYTMTINKYKNYYYTQSLMFDKMAFGFGLLFYVFGITNDRFMIFGLAFVLFLLGMNILIRSIADLMYEELRITLEEWKSLHAKDTNTRTVYKWFFFTKGLNKYLSKQREKGWKVSSISSSKYVFKKSEPGSASYVIDTKSSVNKRMKAKNLQGFNNKKDTLIQNNDWQVQSVKDADEVGLDFIGASGNNIVIYENSNGTGELEYTKNTCTSPLILSFATYVLLGAVIGFLAGFVSVMLVRS